MARRHDDVARLWERCWIRYAGTAGNVHARAGRSHPDVGGGHVRDKVRSPSRSRLRECCLALSGAALTMIVAAGGLILPGPVARAVTGDSVAGEAKAAKASKIARQQEKARKAVAVAKRQIGDPYRYGAVGPGSFDCSGLTQYVWKKAGVRLPRMARSQFAGIRPRVSRKNLLPGDLMFFRGLRHVVMYIGNGKMIHSPRTGERVRIEKLRASRVSSFVGAVRPGI